VTQLEWANCVATWMSHNIKQMQMSHNTCHCRCRIKCG